MKVVNKTDIYIIFSPEEVEYALRVANAGKYKDMPITSPTEVEVDDDGYLTARWRSDTDKDVKLF